MKRIVLLLIATICVACSKSEDKSQETQKTNEQNKEQQEQKSNEQNKKEALIYFVLAKTSLNNRLNKNKEFDFWTNTLKAFEVSNGNEDVYKEVEVFLKNNRFATPRWTDSQQVEINKYIERLNPQLPIINKYENIKGYIDTFTSWK